MIGGIAKKLFFKNSKKEEEKKNNLANTLREKSAELYEGLGNKIKSLQEEAIVMKSKYDNLLETNYNLGLKHIENGNLSEAIFRFRFIKKFWPQHYDSYYQLAYCLVLNKKAEDAKEILEELVSKEPNHQQGRELLELIERDIKSGREFTS